MDKELKKDPMELDKRTVIERAIDQLDIIRDYLEVTNKEMLYAEVIITEDSARFTSKIGLEQYAKERISESLRHGIAQVGFLKRELEMESKRRIR